MTTTRRTASGFASGFAIGNLGGMIGLGGAEFRLPLLVGHFRLDTLSAIILNKACSLVVVATALLIRSTSISPSELWAQRGIVLNLLAGSLLGAWWAAGHAMSIPKQRLNAFILVLLLGLGLFMLAEATIGQGSVTQPLITDPITQLLAGIGAGLVIGMVAAFLGVAGGELLIPTIVLLYGSDIKLAGSLSLAVSLPTMLTGFLRYRSAAAFSVLRQEATLFQALTLGSILGAIAGGLMLGWLDARLLTGGLGLLLLISAWKTFRHSASMKNHVPD